MLEFDEKLHKYSINDRKLLSVTQLLSQVSNPFEADSIIDKMMKGSELYLGDKTELLGMTKEEIKTLWTLNNVAKSRYGTFIHEGAEILAKGFKKNGSYPDCLDAFRPEWKQAQKFFEKEGYTVVESEFQVYSEKYGIAGTSDLLLKKDGLYYIADWKTNVGKNLEDYEGSNWTSNLLHPLNNVPDLHYWVYALQLSIYRYLMETEERYFVTPKIVSGEGRTIDKHPLEFGGLFIIHLQGSKKNCPYTEMKQITYKKIDLPYMRDEVERLLEWYKNEKSATDSTKN